MTLEESSWVVILVQPAGPAAVEAVLPMDDEGAC